MGSYFLYKLFSNLGGGSSINIPSGSNYVDVSVQSQFSYSFGQLQNLQLPDVKKIYYAILDEIVAKVKQGLYDWVDVYVPEATGELKRTIKEAIKRSGRNKDKIIIVFGSNLDYAKYVNNFEDYNVQHSGQKRWVFKGLPPISLNDPEAKGHWFEELSRFAIELIQFVSDQVTRDKLGFPADLLGGVLTVM